MSHALLGESRCSYGSISWIDSKSTALLTDIHFFLVVLPHIPERSGDLKTSYLNGALKIFDLIFAQSLPHDPYEQRIALINLGQNPVCNMIEHQALHIYESDFWWFLFEWLYQTFIQCLNVNLLVNLVQVINIIYNFI